MTYSPDPFITDPLDEPEDVRRARSISALDRLAAAVRAGDLHEGVFFARPFSGFSDLKPETGRHWLWRVHHRHSEVWKCLGRPNWSVLAYASWRARYLATAPDRRLDRRGHPRKETLPKKESGPLGLRHEHVVPMTLMLRSILSGEVTPSEAIRLNQDAIITIAEDSLLSKSGHPNIRDPWARYAGTGIRFIPNPNWSEEHEAELQRHGLVATEDEVTSALKVAGG